VRGGAGPVRREANEMDVHCAVAWSRHLLDKTGGAVHTDATDDRDVERGGGPDSVSSTVSSNCWFPISPQSSPCTPSCGSALIGQRAVRNASSEEQRFQRFHGWSDVLRRANGAPSRQNVAFNQASSGPLQWYEVLRTSIVHSPLASTPSLSRIDLLLFNTSTTNSCKHCQGHTQPALHFV
jgi:hypothetical protein